MTREEILQAFDEALEHASQQYEKAFREAKEWCLKKLKEERENKNSNRKS